MLATTLEANPYLGRLLTGRIESGRVRANMAVKSMTRDGQLIEQARISKILAFRGLDRQPVEEAEAGDIVAIDLQIATFSIEVMGSFVVDDPRLAGPLPAACIGLKRTVLENLISGPDDEIKFRVLLEIAGPLPPRGNQRVVGWRKVAVVFPQHVWHSAKGR